MVRKSTLGSGKVVYTPGGKIAEEIGISKGYSTSKERVSKLVETEEFLILKLGFKEDLVVNTWIESHFVEEASAILNKSTGDVVENNPEVIRNFCGDNCDGYISENVLIFAVNVAYSKNHYAYDTIKNFKILNLEDSYNIKRTARSRTWSYYVLMVRELNFFEKLLKTQKEVFDAEIDNMPIEMFLKKYKENALPQKVMMKICDEQDDIGIQLKQYRDILIRTCQHISENEDGNNANIFIDWLKAFSKITMQKDRIYFEKFLKSMYSLLHEYKYNSKKLTDYLTRQSFFFGGFKLPVDESINLLDYREIAKKCGIQVDLYPTNIYKAHNCLVRNNKAFENISEEVVRNFSEFCKSQASIYEMTVEDYVIRLPRTPKDLFIEGTVLNHCVGGYVERVARQDTVIGFIREKASSDIPLYTIEIMGNKVVQAKGAYNMDVPEEIVSLIGKIEKKWNRKKKTV